MFKLNRIKYKISFSLNKYISNKHASRILDFYRVILINNIGIIEENEKAIFLRELAFLNEIFYIYYIRKLQFHLVIKSIGTYNMTVLLINTNNSHIAIE